MKIAILITILALTSAKKTYEGYKLLRVQVSDGYEADQLAQHQHSYDFWSHIRIGHPVDVLIPPNETVLPSFLRRNGLKHEVIVENVGDMVAASERRNAEARALARTKLGFQFDVYHTYAEMQAYVADTAATYSTASLQVIGQSYEGRNMTVLKVCSSGNCGDHPVMYIECAIHAREWLTSAVCLNMIREVTERADLNRKYVDGIDWYFLTPANPDGYDYTWTDDRYWRKTRSPNFENGKCVGTDPNRNWDAHFGEEGASDVPCSDSYHGPSAFSERCTANIKDFILANMEDIFYFADVHAYSQLTMFPYAYTDEIDCPDYDALNVLCIGAETALENVHGVHYDCGSIAKTIYPASGSTADWTYITAKIMRSFAIETRPTGDLGYDGFNPPESEIIPTSEEIWAWHKFVADDIMANVTKRN